MSTKTMRLPPRRALKRPKEKDDFDLKERSVSSPAQIGSSSVHFLAGYLAHEFLSLGTLFGKPPPDAAADDEPDPKRRRRGIGILIDDQQQRRVYAEIASLLKTGGAHLPGIVNPTELSRFLGSM